MSENGNLSLNFIASEQTTWQDNGVAIFFFFFDLLVASVSQGQVSEVHSQGIDVRKLCLQT